MSAPGSDDEAVRNRLLRRADWRFLLPSPSPAKAICFSGGLLADAVKAVSEVTVDPEYGLGGDCDLAVAVDPDPTTLRAAWAALRPGGSCYTEWFSFRARSRSTIGSRLQAAGFDDVTYYCVVTGPTQEGKGLWIPLEPLGALGYFLRHVSTAKRLKSLVTWILTQMRWHLASFVPVLLPRPVCAIARKPATAGACSSRRCPDTTIGRGPLTQLILDRWREWDFGPTPIRLSWLLWADGLRSRSKVVAFVFPDSDQRPRLTIKMPRIPESVPGLANEAATLKMLAKRPEVARGLAKLLFLERLTGTVMLGQTVLNGQRLDSVIHYGNYRTVALAATAWLVSLAGHVSPSPVTGWWDRLAGSVLDRFEFAFGSVFDRRMFEDTRNIVRTLGALPIVCEHRDFNQFNILQSPSRELAVLDWESSVLEGLPALDLMYFLTCVPVFSLNASSDPDDVRRAYRASVDPSTAAGAVTAECLDVYARRLGLDPSNFHALRVLVWLIHSCSEYEKLVFDLGRRPEPEVLKRGVFVTLWEEELRSSGR